MLFVGTSIIHPSTEGVFLLCNILDLLIYSYQAIPQQFKDEFLNGTFYKSFRFYDQDAPISLSCSFDTETEDQFDEYTRPKIHFFLGSK